MSEEITQNILKELLHYNPDTGVFTWKERDRKWFKSYKGFKTWNARDAGNTSGTIQIHGRTSYLVIKLIGKSYKAHRLAWLYINGVWPEKIDHISGDGLNNRISNLRSVDCLTNSKNKIISINNKSGCTGVHWCKRSKKWCSYIYHNKVRFHLGCYSTLIDAAASRKQAEKKYGFHANHGRKS